MAFTKPVPQVKIDRAAKMARRTGETHYVVRDDLMRYFKVISRRAFNGCGMDADRRHEIVAVANPS